MTRVSRKGVFAVLGGLAAAVVVIPLLLLGAVRMGAGAGVVRAALEAKLGRPVRFAALRTTSDTQGTRLVFTDLVIGQPAAFGPGELARIGRLDLRLRLLPLLAGRFEAPEITVTDPVIHLRRKGPGKDNWTFGHGGGGSSMLGATRRLQVDRGRVDLDDPARHMTLQGSVSHDPADPALPFHLDGSGILNDAPFTVAARGGALNARRAGAAYPLAVRLVDGDTHVNLKGTSKGPFDFDGFDLQFAADGPNLADLIYLFNLLAPNSPRYVATAHMRKVGHNLIATDIKARVGDSDFTGGVVSDHDRPRRLIKATLRSQNLAARDLQAMLASAPPHAQARSVAGGPGRGVTPSGKMLSHAPFSLDRLQHNDILLDYRSASVTGYGPKVSDAALRLELTAGRLKLSPLTFTLADGSASASFAIDTDRKTPLVDLSARLRGARVAALAKDGVTGRLDVDLDAKGTGASFADAAASADGRARVRVTAGALPKIEADVLSGDLLGLVGAALGGGKAPLRCAVADFAITDGTMRATRLAVATGAGLATGGGGIDLKREQLSLALRASSQGRRPPVQLKTPITLTGPFSHPKIDAKLSKATLSLGGVFGALAAPFKGPQDPPASPGC